MKNIHIERFFFHIEKPVYLKGSWRLQRIEHLLGHLQIQANYMAVCQDEHHHVLISLIV